MADALLAARIPSGAGLGSYLEALHVAVRLAEERIQFYTLSANRMRNPRGRSAFHALLREERRRLAVRHGELERLRETLRGGEDEPLVAAAPERSATVNPVFSRGRSLLDRDAGEREVVGLAVAVAWDTTCFFQERAASSEEPFTRLLYGDLALEEKERHGALVEAYEAILGVRR